MGTLAADSDEAKEIDSALKEWRQGDLALDAWFAHVGDKQRPLSKAAVDEKDYPGVKKGQRPALATLPSLETERLAADLDRVMTPYGSEPPAAHTTSTPALSHALARKRVRFAFPDASSTSRRSCRPWRT
jgi:hypothetical protein